MKRLLLAAAFFAISISPAFALTTEQIWSFEPADLITAAPPEWTFAPLSFTNPNPTLPYLIPYAVITATNGTYNPGAGLDGGGSFSNVENISLVIGNYNNNNWTKEIFLMLLFRPDAEYDEIEITVNNPFQPYLTATETSRNVFANSVDGWFILASAWELHPNPFLEVINISMSGINNEIGGVFVITECIPAPGAFLLGGIGAGLVGWLRRRRVL